MFMCRLFFFFKITTEITCRSPADDTAIGIEWFQSPPRGPLSVRSSGFQCHRASHAKCTQLPWWSDAWQEMCEYCRCLRCWPACKMSFARQVMVRIWLADASAFACVSAACLCVCVSLAKKGFYPATVGCAYTYIHVYYFGFFPALPAAAAVWPN